MLIRRVEPKLKNIHDYLQRKKKCKKGVEEGRGKERIQEEYIGFSIVAFPSFSILGGGPRHVGAKRWSMYSSRSVYQRKEH